MMLRQFKSFLTEKFGIHESHFEEITPFLKTQSFKKKEHLVQPGQICPYGFFVESGLLSTYSLNQEGHESILQFATEGWIAVDRGSAFFNEPSIYYIDALEDSRVVLIDHELMTKLTHYNPELGKLNEKMIQNHVRHLNQRISSLLGDSAQSRYLQFLKLYPNVLLRVPQKLVASYLGITPETLSRVRNEQHTKKIKS